MDLQANRSCYHLLLQRCQQIQDRILSPLLSTSNCDGDESQGFHLVITSNAEKIHPRQNQSTQNVIKFVAGSINDQSFTILKNNTFTSFNNLTKIDFTFNKIEIIEKHAFKSLNKLTYLWLDNNKIKELPDGVFHDLQQIQFISICNNNIIELHTNVFSNLPTLTKLLLEHNKITALHAGTFHALQQIKIISFFNNSITDIHKYSFSNLSTVTDLLLNYNKINVIPDGIFNDLQKLETLSLANNCITNLPNKLFSNLPYLKYLSIHDNKIKVLPDGIFDNVKQIKIIYLENNRIVHLQKKLFSDLPNLKRVYISNNAISTIENACFTNLSSLNVVNLKNNKLQTMKIDIIDDVKQLEHFNLNENPWHCDETLCAVIDSASHSFLNKTKCQTPATMQNKTWAVLLFKPLTPHISNVNVEEGQTVRLQCQYCDVSKINWKFNSKINYMIEGSKISLTSTLIINNVTRNETGTYSCHVPNCSTCEEVHISLTVNKRTKITSFLSGLIIYHLISIILIIIVILLGIRCAIYRKIKRSKIQRKQVQPTPCYEYSQEFSILTGPDPTPFPSIGPGSRTSINETQTRNTADNFNRRNEKISQNEKTTTNSKESKQTTSNSKRNYETLNLLPIESNVQHEMNCSKNITDRRRMDSDSSSN